MSTTDLGAFAERAARGAALLDEHEPGWAARINTRTLAMAHCDKCILGQLYNSYVSGVILMIDRIDFNAGWSARHGFTLCAAESDDLGRAAWRGLADAWRAEIRKRVASPTEATS